MSIAALMRKLRPRCAHCRKGVTIDRAWLLVEIARLQGAVRATEPGRVFKRFGG